MKDRVSCGKFCNFCFQTLTFYPKNWMNLISDRLSTASIKYLNWPSPVFGRFQNGCNKVIIEPRVVQFWSEIILVISNRTHAAHCSVLKSYVWFQPKLHSTQFNYHYLSVPEEKKSTFQTSILMVWQSVQASTVNSASPFSIVLSSNVVKRFSSFKLFPVADNLTDMDSVGFSFSDTTTLNTVQRKFFIPEWYLA